MDPRLVGSYSETARGLGAGVTTASAARYGCNGCTGNWQATWNSHPGRQGARFIAAPIKEHQRAATEGARIPEGGWSSPQSHRN